MSRRSAVGSFRSRVSRSEQREPPGATHQYVQLEQPDAVLSAVLDLAS